MLFLIQSENDCFYETATIIEVYYFTKLHAKVNEEFKNEYPESGNISNSAIKGLTDTFEEMGLVHDALGKGRKKW